MGKKSNKDKDEAKAAPPKAEAPPKLTGKQYEKELHDLQVELAYLQDWVKQTGQRIIIVFEGRDAAGKGGTIKAITERVSPRIFKLVALPAPSDREKSQMYFQRYFSQFPAAGEIIIFDRSWYNRAGVEKVMGFCSEKQHKRFLQLCPAFERIIVENGMLLIKFWLEVSDKEQEKRFEARIEDPIAAVEAFAHGLARAGALVRLLPGPRRNAGSHRHRGFPLAHRAFRRQEAGATEHDQAPARTHSLRAPARREEGQAAQAQDQERLRRRDPDGPPPLDTGLLLIEGAP